ncbi:MAG: MotA/TolQ/ExbB proton channel family protein, partial [Deltaproteobacteria bacterium]|nr:MotA/TolQ/ExbB proton channel family protein [Deltaproteobacteria bacterium]
LWYLQRRRLIPDAFVARIEKLIAAQRLDDALLLCQENDTPMAHVMAAALRNASRARERVKEAVEEVGKFQGTLLERYVEVVGTVAAVEPLLGLLGTVLGMITVFQQVETFGLGDPSSFAAGIWEALITTAAGLSVAIPTYLGYKLLLSRVEQLLVEMEERSLRVIDMVARD